MAKAPHVASGWSAPFLSGTESAVQAAADAVKSAAPRADALELWNAYTGVLGTNLPAALRDTRAAASRLHGAVR